MIDLCSFETQRIKNVIAFPFIHDGIPILYYGMSALSAALYQQSLKGLQVRSRATPAVMTLPIVKRTPDLSTWDAVQNLTSLDSLWLSGYVEEKELVYHVKALNAARKAAIATCPDYLFTPMTFPEVTATTLAVYKHPLLALFTNVGSNGTASWHVQATDFAPGTELLEVFSCNRVTVDGDGCLSTSSVGGHPQLYIPASAAFEHC